MLSYLRGLGTFKIVGAFVLLAILGTLWGRGEYYRHQAETWESRAYQHAFTSDSLEATLDTTRVLDSLVISATGDSLRVAMRRVVQLDQQNDALDRALKLERRAKFELAAQLKALDTTATGRTVSTGDSVFAWFHVREAPYSVDADVALPKNAPGEQESITMRGRIKLGIDLDPLNLDLRVGCGEVPAGGLVAPATVSLTGPQWATISLGTLEQSREVCNPPPVTVRKAGPNLQSVGFGAMLGAAAIAILQAVF